MKTTTPILCALLALACAAETTSDEGTPERPSCATICQAMQDHLGPACGAPEIDVPNCVEQCEQADAQQPQAECWDEVRSFPECLSRLDDGVCATVDGKGTPCDAELQAGYDCLGWAAPKPAEPVATPVQSKSTCAYEPEQGCDGYAQAWCGCEQSETEGACAAAGCLWYTDSAGAQLCRSWCDLYE